MSDDLEAYIAGASMDDIIARRSERGKRLAKHYADLPKGLSWEQFLAHDDIADLDLDFITACEMFEAYEGELK